MMQRSNGNSAKILLVEDNPADQRLLEKALQNTKVKVDLFIVGDGQEALDYLERKNSFQDEESSPRPHVILLDNNMPRMTGIEFLSKLRTMPEFGYIPVVMLSTSDQQCDITQAYKYGVNAYLIKPVDIKGFYDICEKFEQFWLQLNVLPSTGS